MITNWICRSVFAFEQSTKPSLLCLSSRKQNWVRCLLPQTGLSNHLAAKPSFWIMYCLLFLYFIEDLKTRLRQMVTFRHYIRKKGLRVSHYLRFPSVLSWSASLLRPQKFEWFLNAAIVTSNRDPPPEVLASTDLYTSRVVFKWTELPPVFCASLVNYIFEPPNNWLVHIPELRHKEHNITMISGPYSMTQ